MKNSVEEESFKGFDMEKFKEELNNMSEEEFNQAFCDNRNIPKGWISIEDFLPYMDASDIFTGGTKYKVKNKEGEESYSLVMDHNIWYHVSKSLGITHWFNN